MVVSWLYYDDNIHVPLMYCRCIGNCLCFPPYSAHHLIGPSLSGYPVLGISSPWVWLLVGGAAMAWKHQTCYQVFCRQGMYVPACPVGCYPAETTGTAASGQASTWAILQAWHTGLLWGTKQGTKGSGKSQWHWSEELNWCFYYVLRMYMRYIDSMSELRCSKKCLNLS